MCLPYIPFSGILYKEKKTLVTLPLNVCWKLGFMTSWPLTKLPFCLHMWNLFLLAKAYKGRKVSTSSLKQSWFIYFSFPDSPSSSSMPSYFPFYFILFIWNLKLLMCLLSPVFLSQSIDHRRPFFHSNIRESFEFCPLDIHRGFNIVFFSAQEWPGLNAPYSKSKVDSLGHKEV